MSLIVIEGLDGSGKATQTRLLLETLQGRGIEARKVNFPDYDSPSSALVKMYLNGEFGEDPNAVNPYAAGIFYAADRCASFLKDWKEDYLRGVTVLADRYTTSNFIYQMGKLPREQWDDYLRWGEELEYGRLGLPRPDRVVYLKMPIEVSQELLSRRYGGDENRKDIHESHLSFLRQSAACAEFAAEKLGWLSVSCGDVNGPLPVEEVRGRVWRALFEAE